MEHPSGHRYRDIKDYKHAKLDEKFDAENLKEARQEAQRRIEMFHTTLPKKREGSTSGNSEPKLTRIIFARVLKL